MMQEIRVIWRQKPGEVSIVVANGALLEKRFEGAGDLLLRVQGTTVVGAGTSVVSVQSKTNPFSFFLRDVDKRFPIWIPEYGVMVTQADDSRSYSAIESDIRAKGLMSNLARCENEPEVGFEAAAAHNRQPSLSTWLGLSRDFRIFKVGFAEHEPHSHDWVEARRHERKVPVPEHPVRYNFRIGRGDGCARSLKRSLEDGCLPILHADREEGDVRYRMTGFVTLEQSELTEAGVSGTNFWVAAGHTDGITFTDEQRAEFDRRLGAELEREEETVLIYRVVAENSAEVPRYAWFKVPVPNGTWVPSILEKNVKSEYDSRRGYGVFESGDIGFVAKLGGAPVPQEEVAVLLKPGETLTFDLIFPHRPVSAERAARLAELDVSAKLTECRRYWQGKLDAAAKLNIPEERIADGVRAGLLHLDLISYGQEPDGPVTPTIGVYPPIGSESSPIIQFMDSMGQHRLAERYLAYFLEKQQDDGAIFNFLEYMIETGCVLWSLGEHYRYTRDDGWVESIRTKLQKSCDYLVAWRNRNKREELRGSGYGMLDGKVADPKDDKPARVYMLNAYAYLGLSRAAEMLANADPEQSRLLALEAEELKRDIRQAYEESLASGPVIPLGDGTWCPTVSPWAGGQGPACLYAEGGSWYSHGSFTVRDSLCGPLYLVFGEIVGSDEPGAAFMLKAHNELMCMNNVALTQPYYSRHPWVHLRRGETKPFLEAYYNSVSAMADRETYTFSEHLNERISEHKTHEEAWFLMETRWMLYMEEGNTLKLLQGIPREWMEDGRTISVSDASSYFGRLSFRVEASAHRIRITIDCPEYRHLQSVEVRLPHPRENRPLRVVGGDYDASSESIRIDRFAGYAEATLEF
ncbi:hypothetical protein [Cohnella sp.]|uniref:hypothetical protein n=1 Tax=Cohnella sp. TaxID=1883426 RepID=UPI0037043828